jgi:hypothetical protein
MFFKLSSLPKVATIDFYRKSNLVCDMDLYYKSIMDYVELRKMDILSMVKNQNNYIKISEIITAVGNEFFYFPNKEIMENKFKGVNFIKIPSRQKVMLNQLINAGVDKNEANKLIADLRKRHHLNYGVLKASGKKENTTNTMIDFYKNQIAQLKKLKGSELLNKDIEMQENVIKEYKEMK